MYINFSLICTFCEDLNKPVYTINLALSLGPHLDDMANILIIPLIELMVPENICILVQLNTNPLRTSYFYLYMEGLLISVVGPVSDRMKPDSIFQYLLLSLEAS